MVTRCDRRNSFANRDAVKEWIIRNQLGRRNLTDAQRVQLALRLKPVAQAKAKERQKEGGATKVVEKSREPVRVDKEIAEAAGVSENTVRKVEKVNAKATPELRAAMNSNAVTINTAADLI